MKQQVVAILLLAIIVGGFSYAIEGTWQAKNYPSVLAEVSGVSSDPDGTNNY